MSKLISIVLTYYQRQELLNKTLESFRQYNPDDFRVIIVDDNSPDNIILPDVPFETIILKLKNKTWFNTASVYNEGFRLAMDSEIIIIQNAECLHNGDILSVARTVTNENYLAFGCYSLGQGETPEVRNNRVVEFTGDSGWYNHSVYRPHAFHFCTAITKENLRKLNGFDERLCQGVAFEDNAFVHQVKNLGLRIDFVDDPFVFHQWHYGGVNVPFELVQHNQDIWLQIEQETTYRAIHVLTPDL